MRSVPISWIQHSSAGSEKKPLVVTWKCFVNISRNGTPAAPRHPAPRRLVPPEAQDSLQFGSKTWHGRIDEVFYRTVEEEEATALANGESVAFDHVGPLRVRFDAEGRLDPRVHEAEVMVKLKDDDGGSRIVRVDMTGLIR